MGSKIYDMLSDYHSNYKRGLMLMPSTVGSGKTHESLRFMAEHLDPEKRKMQFIYVTVSKIVINECEKKLIETFGVKPDYILKAYPHQDHLFETRDFMKIPKEHREKQVAKDAIRAVTKATEEAERIREWRQSENNKWVAESLNKVLEMYKQRAEEAINVWVKEINDDLRAAYPKKKDRMRAIRTDKNWNWIAEFFPNSLMEETPIVLMTIDKFILPFSTPVCGYGRFYEMTQLKDVMIFMDEIDTAKDTVIRHLIEEGGKQRFGLIDVFLTVGGIFERAESLIASLPEKDRDRVRKTGSHCREVFKQICSQYHLNARTHTEEKMESRRGEAFLMHDQKNWTVSGGKSCHVRYEKEAQKNALTIAEEGATINAVIRRIAGFLEKTAFVFISQMADAYIGAKKELTYIEAYRTVLSRCGIKDETEKYFMELFSGYRSDEEWERDKKSSVYSIYREGFSEYLLENETSHNEDTYIYFISIRSSLEKILAHICLQNRVVGLSATAMLNTVLGNLNRDFLDKQGFDILPNPNDTYQVMLGLEEDYQQRNPYTEKGVRIHAEVVTEQDESALEQLFSKNRDALQYVFEYSEMLRASNRSWEWKRYSKLLYLYDQFLKHPQMQAFLCMLNTIPAPGKAVDPIVLKRLFNNLRLENGLTEIPEPFEAVNALAYRTEKDSIHRRLFEGERVFIITSYKTLGQGININYCVRNTEMLVSLDENHAGDGTKDFDAAYFEQPTNLIASMHPEDEPKAKMESRLHYTLQLEELHEHLELRRKDLCRMISKAMQPKGRMEYGKLKDTCSYQNAVVRILFQGIGRLSRARLKNPDIYLFADEDTREFLPEYMEDIEESIILTHEARAFFEALYNFDSRVRRDRLDQETRDLETLLNRMERKAEDCNIFINELVSRFQYGGNGFESAKKQQEYREIWKDMRSGENCILKYLTVGKERYEAFPDYMKRMYISFGKDMDAYAFNDRADFANIKISLGRGTSKRFPKEVSLENARVGELLKMPLIRRYFEEHGFQCEARKGRYILSPAAFQNIYKGVLGEVCGRIILESAMGISLEEITEEEKYEKFDFRVKGKNIYVDFKHWRNAYWTSAEEMRSHITEKAKQCATDRVLVINVLSNNEELKDTEVTIRDGVQICEISYLFEVDRAGNVHWNQAAIEKIESVLED